ncbi:MAG: prenyltransferase/squalene oxidase repeat-containing protein [Planctomycetota bacterium]
MEVTNSKIAQQWSSARHRARIGLDQLRNELLESRTPDGYWTGELAASSLSTATAVSALAAVSLDQNSDGQPEPRENSHIRMLIANGAKYLRTQQNEDGGFGDTDRSHSNIATSYLVLSASTLAGKLGIDCLDPSQQTRLEAYLTSSGELEGLRCRYGKDKTFVVPIMNNMAIAGLISWDEVAALPFEAAVFPQSMYRFLRMPVVSYAIPALVAIGQARHFLGKKAIAPLRWIRSKSIQRTLRVLHRMQPASGGYLEATPLTAFVVMSLAATGRCQLPVVESGVRFLADSMREDGSWPIDTNLATWLTSLSVHALSCDPDDDAEWFSDALLSWHLGCQHLARHPFTGANPGGWGWTDLSGAVPDGDDTPAAILALDCMKRHTDDAGVAEIDNATRRGCDWLLRLQNRDGGWPTFCRGWGKLPFDRSSTDLSAHAMRALRQVAPKETSENPKWRRAFRRGRRFLQKQHRLDGSWLPLWFGNQDRSEEDNPVYGTAKVVIAGVVDLETEKRAVRHLVETQNDDKGWGGGPSLAPKLNRISNESRSHRRSLENLTSSMEETALAVEALCRHVLRLKTGGPSSQPAIAAGNEACEAAILSGVEFLIQGIEAGRHHLAWPIGFYFAKLWYHEKLYPTLFATAALGTFLSATAGEPPRHLPG